MTAWNRGTHRSLTKTWQVWSKQYIRKELIPFAFFHLRQHTQRVIFSLFQHVATVAYFCLFPNLTKGSIFFKKNSICSSVFLYCRKILIYSLHFKISAHTRFNFQFKLSVIYFGMDGVLYVFNIRNLVILRWR